jgi:transposase
MAYRYGERHQMDLLPPSVESYVSTDDPVRAYDAFVDAMDFNELGIAIKPHQIGCPSYDPRTMLKLLVYGYSYGIRSSRKLERATLHNVSFMWLMGGLKPDHKTIAEFRRNNKSALRGVLKQCARLCLKLNLISGNTLFVDGTLIRANASIKNSWTRQRCKKVLNKVDKKIEAILAECESVDREEQDQTSMVKMNQDLKDSQILKTKVKNILKELKKEGKNSLNTTDPECVRTNGVHGSHAGYNAQSVVDEKYGLIVSSDVISENNDTGQFAEQVDQANKTLGEKCQVACADAGYSNTDELEKVNAQNIKVVVPSKRQASRKKLKPFDIEHFYYDAEKDQFLCPEGQILPYSYLNKKGKTRIYSIPRGFICQQCRYFGICTKSSRGRSVSRLIREEAREKFEAQYKQPESQAIYKLRQEKVELPFGHIKRNLKVDAFLLRGKEGAKAEMALLSSCFNIVRMITILGVSGVIQQIG